MESDQGQHGNGFCRRYYFTELRWYQQGKIEKHLIDAAFVYQIQRKNLDEKYLKLWVKKLGLEDDFEGLEKINIEEYL